MKINHKILSIPPHISTAWQNIDSLLCTNRHTLAITLKNGAIIEVPGLDGQTIQQIFAMHEEVLEGDKPSVEFSFGMPLPIEGLPNVMQHDPAQASAPTLPAEMLEKVASIAKVIGIDQIAGQMPHAEPHCNCPHCQMVRALSGDTAPSEEEVPDSELTFRDWSVEPLGQNLYKVTSPFDPSETYQVSLGDQVGCTCGSTRCEHIKVALNT